MSARPRTPDDVRLAVDRALARVGGEGPRDLAVHLALSEGISAEEALARCGVDVPDAEAERAVAFVRLPHGAPFRIAGQRYRKVSARTAKTLAFGAPNAVSLDGGAPRWLGPGDVVERIPTVVAPVRRAG